MALARPERAYRYAAIATVFSVLGGILDQSIVAQIRGGDAKGLNFLMGQLMKRTQGKADPKAVRAILARKLAV